MITKGLEDYLEIIYNATSKNESIKAIDIANKLNISRSSVSEALIRLADKNLITYNGRKGISITQEGEIEAKKIIEKHNTLYKFFTEILGIDEATSNQNACRIEHVIDDKIVKKINSFTLYCSKNSINKKFKENK